MKLSIEQIRDKYRKSTCKDATLISLAESEGVSVSTIKLYVRGVMSSAELVDMAVANGAVEAIIPAAIHEEKPLEIKKTLDSIPAKRRGRPVKNLKPSREPATPREELPVKKVIKAPKTVIITPETVIKVPEIVNATAAPVVDEIKCGKVIPIAHHYEAEGEPPYIKYTCPNGCKYQVNTWHKTCHCCNAILDWSEVNGPSIIDEPKPKDPTVQFTHFEPVTQVEREMFFADIADDEPAELQKPQMTLLGQEVKNFDDVTRVMLEAKAAKQVPEPKPWVPDPMITEENKAMREEAARCAAAPRPSSCQIITNEEVEAQPKATTHILKCQQPYFNAVWDGHKTFEARLNDRDYKSGDSVVLKDYNPSDDTYGNRQIRADIGFLLSGEKFPFLNKQYVVFTLLNIKRFELREVRP